MWSLTRDENDRGAVLVWVALMIAVVIGVGAIVIDAGALYTERRQLQNGADAAALAVAADCAEGDCKDEAGTANTYADSNANDGAANVKEVCGSAPSLTPCVTPPPGAAGASGWVRVTTTTHNPANSNPSQVKFLLAPFLDALNVGRTVEASAVAAWGPIGKATTIPFTFSVCEFEFLGGSLDGLTFPDHPDYIYSHKTPPSISHDCGGNPSGQNLPGGFGWLDSDNCEATVDAGESSVGSDPGNNLPDDCDATTWRDAEVVIPLYDECVRKANDATKCESGQNAEYHIAGFVGFKVLGYKVGNDSWNMPGNGKCPDTSGNSGRCFYGEFTRVTTSADAFGDGTDFGARTISMIG